MTCHENHVHISEWALRLRAVSTRHPAGWISMSSSTLERQVQVDGIVKISRLRGSWEVNALRMASPERGPLEIRLSTEC